MNFSSGRGDVETLILKKATEFGAHPKVPHSAPGSGSSWRYAEDKYGIVIRMDPKQYSFLELFLRESLGAPGIGPTEKDGFRFVQYRLTTKGGGIQLTGDSKYTQVIIIKPQVSPERVNTN